MARVTGKINLAGVVAAQRAAVQAGLVLATEHLRAAAVARTPVETGALRASATTTVAGNTGTVAYTASYAVYVHEILRNRHPVGEAKYLENALTAETGTIAELLATAIRQAVA